MEELIRSQDHCRFYNSFRCFKDELFHLTDVGGVMKLDANEVGLIYFLLAQLEWRDPNEGGEFLENACHVADIAIRMSTRH